MEYASTTIGVSTDAEGNYRLMIPEEGTYRLTVSHVGYQSVFKDIIPGKESLVFDAAMSIRMLEEVKVSAKVRFRRRDINLFWNCILGKPPSPNTIYASNPESVYYYYNPESRILKVTCREPLLIINNETGYQIQAVVNHFTHNYRTNTSVWETENRFTELDSENSSQKAIWEENRKKIYQVSLTKFIKSLYNNTLMEDGFLLVRQRENVKYEDLIKFSNTFVFNNPAYKTKVLSISPDLNLILVCFGKSIDREVIHNVNQAQIGKNDWSGIGLIRNYLKTPNGQVQIFPDGTFKNLIVTSPFPLSNSLTGLDMKLPVEYIPQ